MNKRRNIAFIIIVLLAIIIPIFLNNFAANVEKFTNKGLITTIASIKTNLTQQVVHEPTKSILLFGTTIVPLNVTSANVLTTGSTEVGSGGVASVSNNPTGAEAFTLSQSRMDYLNTSQSQYQQPQPLSQQSQTTQSQPQSQPQTSGGSFGSMYNQAVNFFAPSS
jgi:hypothetical protein